MKKYNIAGIKLAFDFQYTDYFQDNIEHYQINYDDAVDYTLSVKTYRLLDPLDDIPNYETDTSKIYINDHDIIVISFDENNKVKEHIELQKDSKKITINITKTHNITLAELEYHLSGSLFSLIALNEGKTIFKGSAIKHKTHGVIFSPIDQNSHKHTHYWNILLDDIEYINDAFPIIYKDEDAYMIAGSPWSGKRMLNSNQTAPLKAIVFVKEADRNTITKLSKNDALVYFNTNKLYPDFIKHLGKQLSPQDVVFDTVPCYLLEAKNDASSVTCVYKKLFQSY